MKYICTTPHNTYVKGQVYERSGFDVDLNYFKEFKFEVGDTVSHVFYDGEFEIKGDERFEIYPICIDAKLKESFTADGISYEHHDKPTIHFIRRPSLEVKEKNEVVLMEHFNLCSSAIVFLDSACARYNIYSKNVQDENPNVVQKIDSGRKLILDLDTWELREYKEGE